MISTLFRILFAEALKLRRSAALRLVWGLPLIFIVLDFWVFGRGFLRVATVGPEEARVLSALPLKAMGNLWTGFFHPLLLALLPALLLRHEHRSLAWKHLGALPVPKPAIYLGKAITLLSLMGISLGMAILGLWIEWSVLHHFNPLLYFPFPWHELGKVVGWLLLGSLPLLALYLWLADRINSGVVPLLFGAIGLLLNISLSGQELDPSWRRDLIPWVLPYTCVQQAIERSEARQEIPAAGVPFNRENDLNRFAGKRVETLPSGRKITTITDIPDYFLLPPPPTPKRLLAVFSLGAGMALLLLGLFDATRSRALHS